MEYKTIPIKIWLNPDKWIIGFELSRMGLIFRVSRLCIAFFWREYELKGGDRHV